jgi:hypothetical protein
MSDVGGMQAHPAPEVGPMAADDVDARANATGEPSTLLASHAEESNAGEEEVGATAHTALPKAGSGGAGADEVGASSEPDDDVDDVHEAKYDAEEDGHNLIAAQAEADDEDANGTPPGDETKGDFVSFALKGILFICFLYYNTIPDCAETPAAEEANNLEGVAESLENVNSAGELDTTPESQTSTNQGKEMCHDLEDVWVHRLCVSV